MTKFREFEELPVWQKAKDIAILIYNFSETGKISKDYSLKDQIRRSAISISSNIAEGYERGTTKEFIRYLYIAKGSAGELRSQLIIAKELGYLNSDAQIEFLTSLKDISRQLSGFINSFKAKL